jgi:branched-chain amino acid transport system substrate-binding protein
MLRWLAIPLVAIAALHSAAAEPFRVALVGNFDDIEVRHAEQGFRLGLDYASHGALTTHRHAIEVVLLDDHGEAALGARLLADAFQESRADIAVNLDEVQAPEMLRAAGAARRILLLARGAVEAPIDDAASRFVFRTGPSASQLALACVFALGTPELNLVAVAPDTVTGHDAVSALKDALERLPRGVFFVGSKFIRPEETDIGGAVRAGYDDFHYLHGAKTLLILWSGPEAPISAIAATNPGHFGIRLALCGNMDPNASQGAAIDGVTSYFYSLPRNPANERLVAAAQEHDRGRPDTAMADGMTAGIAVVEMLAAAPSTEAAALVSSLAGLSFETPKGRMIIRPKDHQALQVMYQFRVAPPSGLPELEREIGASEIPLPVPRDP